MHILLVAATTFEIQPTIDYLGKKGPGALSPVSPLTVTSLITGVGSIATSWSLMHQTRIQRPDLIIQAGIAGCFAGMGKKHGEVVTVREELLADLGVWEEQRFKTLFDLKLAGNDTPPFSSGKLINPYQRLLALTGLDAVTALTVNEITTDPVRIAWYQQNIPAVVEGMEGGALHYVCLQEKIPFIQLRSISNEIGVRDKAKWDIRSAITNLNEQLISLLEKLNVAEITVLEL